MGLPHAAAALRKLERQQEIVANNLANVSTAGFKAERAFAHLMGNTDYVQLGAATDRRQGSIAVTNNPLDLALERDGFFVVQTPTGEQLTRGGSFRLDTEGYLVDARGAKVLGEDPAKPGISEPVKLPANAQRIAIGRDGAITADGVGFGRLRVEGVPPNESLQHAGDGRFLPSDNRRPLINAERAVRQGAVEESNVSQIEAMVSLIDIQRAYTSAQRAVSAIDDARAIVVGDLARPR
ncbi:MAG: flagellar hook basal-body protein [Gemmatimonadaceae bacterium]|nr:flagellar hook basal-body protein [Gemmatimonadaceae bacterium]